MSYGAKKKRIVNGEEVSEQVYQEMLSDDLLPKERRPAPAPAEPEEEDSLFEKIKKKIGKPHLGEAIGKNIQKLKK
jgi:ribosomal protein S6E (S10)